VSRDCVFGLREAGSKFSADLISAGLTVEPVMTESTVLNLKKVKANGLPYIPSPYHSKRHSVNVVIS